MRKAIIVTLAGAALMFGAAAANGKPLGGAELERAVAGRRIYLSVPLGGEFPLFYRPDGRVDGSGEAVGLGRFLKPNDSGRWWVSGDRLCQKWRTWYDGRTFCFTISRQAGDKLAWTRDDGMSGIARIAD